MNAVERLTRWWQFCRSRPQAVDLVVAVLLVAGSLASLTTMRYSAPVSVAVGSAVALNGAVALRRRAPTVAALIALVGVLIYQLTTNDQQGAFESASIVLIFYLVGKRAVEAGSWRRPAMLVAGGLVVGVIISGTSSTGSAAIAWLPMMLAPLVVGAFVARSERMGRQLTATLGHLKDEQERRADEAAGEERNRVARELHDVVAHGVSVMVIQAGAARLIGRDDADAARAALRVVVASGREAVADLRRIMGALRRNTDSLDGPPGGLAQLDRLVDRVRAGGVPTELLVEGQLSLLPPSLDLVAYRVVQEALTNVVKHSGAACARVYVKVDQHTLGLTVTDTGSAAGHERLASPASGQGLVGMRERVSLYGGQLQTGHRREGGFEVSARIPLIAVPAPRRSEAPELAAPVVTRPRRRIITQRRADFAVAGLWFVGLETAVLTSPARGGAAALDALIVAVMTAGALWRRRSPLLFLLLTGVLAQLLSSGVDPPDKATLIGVYTLVVPLYTVAAWQIRKRAILGLTLFIVCATAINVSQNVPAGGTAGALIMGCLVWAVGRVACEQRTLAANLRESTALLSAEREVRARLAVASERTRIARELNALVADGVIAMVVQAEAAQQLLDDGPCDAALDAIRNIERTGRGALVQLRNLLGVLRAPHAGRELVPQPGLDQLHALIQCSRDGGQAVEFTVHGEPRPLAPGIDLVVYRIVEEAIAHANHRTRSRISIALSFGDDNLELDVCGPFQETADWPTSTIRERVALYDGAVRCAEPHCPTQRTVVTLPRALQGAWV